MSLLAKIESLPSQFSTNSVKLTAFSLNITLKEFQDLTVEINEKYHSDFVVNWLDYDITKNIKYLLPGGLLVTINVIKP